MGGEAAESFEDEGTLVLEQRFAIVPEWVIDAEVSDSAYRLYSVLLRYGQSSGTRMPGRALLARRLKKKSTDSVDRALKELVAAGAVVVERRRRGRQNLTNRYHLMSTPPAVRAAFDAQRPLTDLETPVTAPLTDDGVLAPDAIDPVEGGRTVAATPAGAAGSRIRAARGGRTNAAGVAAQMRPDPGVPTEEIPPPSGPSGHVLASDGVTAPTAMAAVERRVRVRPASPELLAALGVVDLEDVALDCRDLRRRAGQPTGRWTASSLARVLHDAVLVHGWPATDAVAALLTIAADPATRSPARLACAGPWWDRPVAGPAATEASDQQELTELEDRLAESDGRRVWAQREARTQLATAGEPVTRLTVARRACALLDELASAPSEPVREEQTGPTGAARYASGPQRQPGHGPDVALRHDVVGLPAGIAR